MNAREPHRHDYRELICTRTGSCHHALDDRTVDVIPVPSSVRDNARGLAPAR